ncbi:MAG: hypothetical protein CVU13_09855 [Bacteroidetes bacterium HGW-Bacteroidetes-8]|jgi:hypothetical protein|nr:MAG: hypothetical protein CVU13_09855 [Bacteroidetes bacterium HGW-Bacteroidetes-8]
MKRKLLIFATALSVMVIACNPSSNNNAAALKIIDIENSINTIQVVKLSEVANSIEYIPLETSDSILIGNISKIVCENNKIYVSDNSDKLFVFDREGMHLRTLNRKGRGPGEYVVLRSFKVDDVTGNILVLDFSGRVNIYDSLHNFVQSIEATKKGVNFTGFENFGDTIFAASHFVLTDNASTEIIIYDSSSITRDSVTFRPIDFISSVSDNSEIPLRINHPVIVKYNNEIRYFSVKGDTIFSLNSKLEKSVAYLFNQGKYREPDRITFEDFMSKNGSFISISPYLSETDGNLFLTMMLRGQTKEPIVRTFNLPDGTVNESVRTDAYGIFRKTDGKFFILAQPVKGVPGLSEDFKQGPPFWPKFSNSNQELISHKSAVEIINFARDNGEFGSSIKEVASKIDDYSNPVVIIAQTR